MQRPRSSVKFASKTLSHAVDVRQVEALVLFALHILVCEYRRRTRTFSAPVDRVDIDIARGLIVLSGEVGEALRIVGDVVTITSITTRAVGNRFNNLNVLEIRYAASSSDSGDSTIWIWVGNEFNNGRWRLLSSRQ